MATYRYLGDPAARVLTDTVPARAGDPVTMMRVSLPGRGATLILLGADALLGSPPGPPRSGFLVSLIEYTACLHTTVSVFNSFKRHRLRTLF